MSTATSNSPVPLMQASQQRTLPTRPTISCPPFIPSALSPLVLRSEAILRPFFRFLSRLGSNLNTTTQTRNHFHSPSSPDTFLSLSLSHTPTRSSRHQSLRVVAEANAPGSAPHISARPLYSTAAAAGGSGGTIPRSSSHTALPVVSGSSKMNTSTTAGLNSSQRLLVTAGFNSTCVAPETPPIVYANLTVETQILYHNISEWDIAQNSRLLVRGTQQSCCL
jgi:hypothetical protein